MAEADWTAVWRYLPTFTPETYWLRIIGGHIFLTEGEVTDVIVAAKKSMKHEGSIDMHDIELGEDPDLVSKFILIRMMTIYICDIMNLCFHFTCSANRAYLL